MTTISRRLLLPAAVAAALAAAAPAFAATTNVAVKSSGFSPSDVTIGVGGTVTWTNEDASARQVVATGNAFASPVLASGESFSFTFKEAGKFNYHDAFTKKLRGTVTVSAGAAVTLASSRTVVVFGRGAQLSGKASSGSAGEAIAIFAKAFGESAFTKLADVTTTTGGSWTLLVKPKAHTSYEARWKNATSAQLGLSVRPRVTLTIRSGVFVSRVLPARPGKLLRLQRWSVQLRQWIPVKSVRLNASSRARFRWKPPRGDYKVRLFMPAKQSGPGLLAGWSPARIFVRG